MAAPLVARAQQPRAVPVIGFLHGAGPDAYAKRVAAFLKGLSDAGFVAGKDIEIEYRWAKATTPACRTWRETWCAETSR